MKRLALACLCFLSCGFSPGHSAEEASNAVTVASARGKQAPRDPEQVFGVRSTNTISVVVSGNVDHPGNYNVYRGTGLKSLPMIVRGFGGRGDFGGGVKNILLFRIVNGVESKMQFRKTDLNRPDTPDFPLLEGDRIWVDEIVF